MKATGKPWPAPKNDRLLRAAKGLPVDRAPKWMMRQAGRYLPEYMAVLKKFDFFTVCRTPALVAEVTLQPYRRYPSLDSLIVFSDILVIPVAMGMPCKMVPATGPQFDFAIKTPEDLDRLNLSPDVDASLSYVFDAVFFTRQQVGNEVPVIGFSGAPWTLMGYMVEGGAVRSFDTAKKWLYLYPEASRKLLKSLRDIVVEYLVGQFDSGAPLLTVFDTNCGEVPPSIYQEFCVPDLKHIATEVKRRRPTALITIFPKDGEMGVFNDSDYDVVGVSWKASPTHARAQCPDKTLQGNLDPHLLYADPAQIRERAAAMVKEFGVHRYISNLGHGMLPTHPVEGPAAYMEGVDSVLAEGSNAGEGEGGDAPAAEAVAVDPADASGSRGPTVPLTLHLQEGTSISVPFTEADATELKDGLATLIATFKEKMAATRPRRWEDFEHTATSGDFKLEVFCNLNAFATIFDVKLFVTVRSGPQIKVSSEIPLATLQGDLEAFLA